MIQICIKRAGAIARAGAARYIRPALSRSSPSNGEWFVPGQPRGGAPGGAGARQARPGRVPGSWAASDAAAAGATAIGEQAG